ncbi:hypothetical protein NKI80_25260 [Mesorhizobium sp. M0387]|uniref:hypothetical protein n=1 Tax=Mesorhizobium sp. M0387 TaxID=2956940 RepID=UPI003334E3C5
MNKIAPKTPGGQIKVITDASELILWLAAKAKASEPQVEMPKGMIRLFDIVVTEFEEEGCLEEPWDWPEWFSNEFYSLYELETERCSAIVSWLATNCYAEIINRKETLYADYFIRALVAGVLENNRGGSALVRFTVEGPITKVRSTAAFQSLHGFRIWVNVRNCAPEVGPNRRKIKSGWLKDL